LICGLLAATAGLGSWSAYREVRRSATAAATDRLDRVARQLVSLLSTSARGLDSIGHELAEDSAVNAYLRSNSPADRARATAAIARRRPPNANNPPAFELWDRDGGRRLASDLPPIDSHLAREMTLAARGALGSHVSPLWMRGDTVVYTVVTVVRSGEQRLGHVVQRRRMSGNPQGARQLAQLVGTDATLLFGNTRGDVWTDLAARTEGPPSGTIDTSRVVRYERPGSGPRFARALGIPNTPWMVAVEFPESVVLEQVGGFVWRTALAAAAILLVAAFGAWMVSRRLTAPLSELSLAAQAISDGDYGRRVSVHRGDELGKVAESFNRMAEQVGRTHLELEAQVQDRTVALKASEEQFRSLAETAHDAIVSADAQGHIIYFNPAAERIFGYTPAEVMGKPLTVLMPEQYHRAHEAGFRRYLSTGDARVVGRTVELAGRRKNGSEFPLDLSLAAAHTGGAVTFTGIIRDTTERKQAEDSVRRHRQELQEFINSTSTFLAKVSPDGKFLMVNRMSEQASGMTSDQLFATNFLDGPWWTFDPEVHERVRAAFERAVAGEPVNYDEQIFIFDRELTINFSLVPVRGSDGNVAYLVAEGRDVSALKAANRELEAFSYSVSHDLRAPLRAIGGFSRLLLDDHGSKLAADGRRMLDVISENTRRMGELIDDLLAFSRLGRKPLTVAPVDMTALVRSVVSETIANHQGPKPEVRVADLPAATGDMAMLRQVWVNLVSNALKFSRTREAPRLEIGVNGGTTPAYYVKDNGVGFDMRFADKLFGVFQRLHRQEEFDGTGVGLAIVHRIVQRHGGRVWADAAPDAGATFFFTLPTAGA
jgi:PAS domain S-box-containing protein